jgi:hypothetical protein
VDVVVGDFDGDGKDDIAGRLLSSGEVFVARSTGSAFTTTRWNVWANFAPWMDVRVGDFNSDGKDDLVAGILLTGPVDTNNDGVPDTTLTFRDLFVAESSGTSFTQRYWHSWDSRVTWTDVLVGDFDADGQSDVVARVQENGAVFLSLDYTPATVRGFGGQKFWQLWANPSQGVTWADVRVGDFDGDGKDDLVARVLQNGVVFVSRGFDKTRNYAANPVSQQFWATWPAGQWGNVLVGDFNGDGRDDLAARLLSDGRWFVSTATSQNTFNHAFWGATWLPSLNYTDVLFGQLL